MTLMRRISLYVDGNALFYMQKEALGWWLDPRKLLSWLGSFGQVVDAGYYVSVDPEKDQQHRYHTALTHMGYRVQLNPLQSITVGDQTRRQKASLDIDIVTDMFTALDQYDEVVLLSGAADFVRPLEIIRSRGKSVRILATKNFVAADMRSLAGLNFVDLADL